MAELKDTPENKFWVIEVTNALRKKGFLIVSPAGIAFAVGGYDINVKQFYTEESARDFVKENKIYKMGTIRIVSNQEILDTYASPAKGDVFVIVNEKDEHLFFDTAKEKYYFADRKIGCCAWFDKSEVEKFIKYRQPEFPYNVLIAVQMNDPGAKPVNDIN
jgi:hypothetical protein